jgi:hypothetical protein
VGLRALWRWLPQGLKPGSIADALRGAEAPLFPGAAGGGGLRPESKSQGLRLVESHPSASLRAGFLAEDVRNGVPLSMPGSESKATTGVSGPTRVVEEQQVPHRAWRPVRNDIPWLFGRFGMTSLGLAPVRNDKNRNDKAAVCACFPPKVLDGPPDPGLPDLRFGLAMQQVARRCGGAT